MDSHPYAETFPFMDAADLASLAEDIKQSGLRTPVTLYENEILDRDVGTWKRVRWCLRASRGGGPRKRVRRCLSGERNRPAAATLAGVESATREFPGEDSLAFVLPASLQPATPDGKPAGDDRSEDRPITTREGGEKERGKFASYPQAASAEHALNARPTSKGRIRPLLRQSTHQLLVDLLHANLPRAEFGSWP